MVVAVGVCLQLVIACFRGVVVSERILKIIMVAVEVYLQTATIVVFNIVADNQTLAKKTLTSSSSPKRSFG